MPHPSPSTELICPACDKDHDTFREALLCTRVLRAEYDHTVILFRGYAQWRGVKELIEVVKTHHFIWTNFKWEHVIRRLQELHNAERYMVQKGWLTEKALES